ncbi:hypothetical protein [Streptomyces sp. CS090A]|uniref:hypothetical protein n=1 Tax=Streptomyces sp. CS090A TaxID=2162710 RepID=UPI00195086BC|nr:hypothetical protein [Streptomyces sp. CS090A]
MLFSTQLPTDGGTMTVHALQAPGNGGRLFPAEVREPNPNDPPCQANVMPGIHPPAEGLVAPEPVRGCHVQAKDYAWFQASLAHTTAAGLMAFTSVDNPGAPIDHVGEHRAVELRSLRITAGGLRRAREEDPADR